MHELITAVLLALRWLAYAVVTLLIPVAVMVPVVITVDKLAVGPFTSAGLSGVGLLVTVALIHRLWHRYQRHADQTKHGRHRRC